MNDQLAGELITILTELCGQLERLTDDPDRYDYQQTWKYETPGGNFKCVKELRQEGWKVYKVETDADGDIVWVMRRPRKYGA